MTRSVDRRLGQDKCLSFDIFTFLWSPPSYKLYLSCCRYFVVRRQPGCQMMTKTCLKIKVCLNVISDCGSDICHQYPSLRQRETEGWSSASKGRVRTKAGWPSTAEHRAGLHHTAPHRPAAAEPLCVRLSVTSPSPHQPGGRGGTGSLLG